MKTMTKLKTHARETKPSMSLLGALRRVWKGSKPLKRVVRRKLIVDWKGDWDKWADWDQWADSHS